MDTSIAVKVDNLSKIYKLYNTPMDRFKEALHPFKKRYHKDFYALNSLCFDIKRGETVGIIGKNGSGKSTLLKIITGVLTPTEGTVKVNGRVSALLELGAGFNPEYTGIENIYFQGNLMGFTREEMDSRIEGILNFADIGEFIHQPVKTYSSGMFARLAFAVAINVEPDILIVDEALSVGDFSFQYKCFMKFKEFQSKNKTVIFVTHSMQDVVRYCHRAIFIHQGNLIEDSYNVEDVVFNYETVIRNKDAKYFVADEELVEEHRFGTFDARITKITFMQKGDNVSELISGEPTQIQLEVDCYKQLSNLNFGWSLKNLKGVVVWGDNSQLGLGQLLNFEKGKHVICIDFLANIVCGEYYFYIGLSSFIDRKIDIDQRWRCKKIKLFSLREMAEGIIHSPSKITIHPYV